MIDQLISCQPVQGYNSIFEIGQKRMDLTGFGLLKLAAGQSWTGCWRDDEVVMVILGGQCTVTAGGEQLGQLGERKDVFSGNPYTIYLPPSCECHVTAVNDLEIAIAQSPHDQPGKPVVVTPQMVKSLSLGKDNHQRDAIIMIGDDFPTRHFYVGEAWVPSGNWGSYPPHRHDFDNPPHELNMQELYFFRFNPQHGYGIQQLYTDDRQTDTCCQVNHNDTVVIPEGYHPVVNAPGYTMYFLWIMTGNSRGFMRSIDPRYADAVR